MVVRTLVVIRRPTPTAVGLLGGRLSVLVVWLSASRVGQGGVVTTHTAVTVVALGRMVLTSVVGQAYGILLTCGQTLCCCH